MKTIRLLILLTLLTFGLTIQAQDWQLVWSDEFTNGISSDWVFEIGNGTNGWGNNELQYYREENATVENGQLVITARQENFGGFNYTSARMKTQDMQSWQYGRIEARIALPSSLGLWPAFWMLGSNITTVGWPACGEIDIMEHVNTDPESHGTIHWEDLNGTHASFGGSTTNDVTNYHVYSIEWDDAEIRWYVDGVQYHVADISNGVNGTDEFHNDFFILLNMAVGGNWPGFEVDDAALPANMYVDYVRVYQDDGTNPPDGTAIPGTIQAENWTDMSGVQTEPTTDDGGGENVGWIDTGDWMDYAVNVESSGEYAVNFRVASVPGGGVLELRSGNSVLTSINIPSTGGWQNWTTISANANLSAGNQTIRLYAASGGFNVNWVGFEQNTNPPSGFDLTVQAEDYDAMSGIQTEGTTDDGGGENVGWIDAGDWMAYNDITIPESGTYTVEYRVASLNGGGQLSLDLNGGATVLGTLDVPSTGGWQNWTTISHDVFIDAGTYNFGIYAPAGGWNINWWHISNSNNTRTASDADFRALQPDAVNQEVSIYPNPATDKLNISGINKDADIAIFDLNGKTVMKHKTGTNTGMETLDISALSNGTYYVKMKGDKISETFKLIKY